MNSTYIFGVAQLAAYIKSVLDAEDLIQNIRVTGEVTDVVFRAKSTFFTIKDAAASLHCVSFSGRELPIADGDKVVLCGSICYYQKTGRISFVVDKAEPVGLGQLYRQFMELKKRLQDEGLFDNKILPPPVIRRIGVITSETGAVIHDIASVARRRDPNIDIVLYPVRVQGAGAAEEIADAVARMDAYPKVDAIILARGGGSGEDLSQYNDERVARAVARCEKYIVSAVGHETDFSLCDECADARAATPSVAAEMLTKDTARQRKELQGLTVNLFRALIATYKISGRRALSGAKALKSASLHALDAANNAGVQGLIRLDRGVRALQAKSELAYRRGIDRLELSNPLQILRRGYARVFLEDKTLRFVRELTVGAPVRVRMADGVFLADVTKIEPL